jgi:hypothetical protein
MQSHSSTSRTVRAITEEDQMNVVLTDNTGTIYDRANVKQESLDELNRIANESTAGNVWWEPEDAIRECQGCGRIMSEREFTEQRVCDDCAT